MRGTGRVFKRTNSAFWWIAYCHRGKEIRESSGSLDRKDAEKLLKQRLKEIGADSLGLKAFVGPQQDRLTVGELLDALEADLRLREVRSFSRILSHLRQVRSYFGDWKAVQVTPEAVDRYIESRLAEEMAPATVNRETGLLAQAFRLAVERRRLSTAPKIRKLSERGNARQGFFEKADFEAVADRLPDYLRGFAWFGYLSGWRKGEIRSLAWADVDMGGGVIRLRAEHSKNGEGRVLTLQGELGGIIRRQWEARQYKCPDGTVAFSLCVFHRDGSPIGDIRKAWASACKDAKVEGRLFHDLRRTAVRNMVRAGVPERVSMSISGHKTRAIFDRYNIVSEADIRQAMEKTQAYLNSTPSERTVVSFPETQIEAAR